MRVKRYVVDQLPEAVALIRSELGKDAVILESRPVAVGGFMGLFRKKKIEVTAAVEENPAASETVSKPSAADVNQILEQILKSSSRMAAPPPEPAPAVKENPINPAQMPVADRSISDKQILEELQEMRQQMMKLSKQQAGHSAFSDAVLALRQRLLDQEVELEWIERLTNELLDQYDAELNKLSPDELWRAAADRLEEWLASFGPNQIHPEAAVVHFVGPTGVGKTTTIAKLAAEYKIKNNKRVGFITSDTYRIAAVDQLRTYATILDIPLEIVFSQGDLHKAYDDLSQCDIILMDTAGRNYQSELHVSEVNSLFQSSRPSETILVLSLTGKTKDMEIITERFTKYGITKALFTKLDETTVYGAILNLTLKYNLIPTFVAGGQTVPDDIERFDRASYIQLLLGEVSDE